MNWSITRRSCYSPVMGSSRPLSGLLVVRRVATELPASVTDPETAARIRQFNAEAAIPANSFARAVAFAISQPEDVDINEIVFRPTRRAL